jgi:type I restriction enzyme M protein
MFEQAFRNIDDALRKEAGCATELDYAEQTSWLLFLKYNDLRLSKSKNPSCMRSSTVNFESLLHHGNRYPCPLNATRSRRTRLKPC